MPICKKKNTIQFKKINSHTKKLYHNTSTCKKNRNHEKNIRFFLMRVYELRVCKHLLHLLKVIVWYINRPCKRASKKMREGDDPPSRKYRTKALKALKKWEKWCAFYRGSLRPPSYLVVVFVFVVFVVFVCFCFCCCRGPIHPQNPRFIHPKNPHRRFRCCFCCL